MRAALHQRCWTVILALATLIFAGAALGQSFPSKSIRLVIPYNTAGSPDVLARLVAAKVSESAGQQMVVENRPGAGGVLATQVVAKAPPDGYTVLMTGDEFYAITPALHSKLPYDPNLDFAPVTNAASVTHFLIVNPALEVSSVQELIALAKTRPGKINYGSSGNGSALHLAMEQFKLMAGVDLVHVPYKGIVQVVPALLAGDVSLVIGGLPAMASHIKTGRLRILAVVTPTRSPLMPEVPTVAEAGVSGFGYTSTFGFMVPANTPREVVQRLNAEIVKALRTPDIEGKLFGLGIDVIGDTPEQFAAQIRKDQEYYRRFVRQLNVKID
jgi:tripartite-type tricarboxylate transporter receptor subunit TctC